MGSTALQTHTHPVLARLDRDSIRRTLNSHCTIAKGYFVSLSVGDRFLKPVHLTLVQMFEAVSPPALIG